MVTSMAWKTRIWMPLTGSPPEDVAKLFRDYKCLEMLPRIASFISRVIWCQPFSLSILMILREQYEIKYSLGLTKVMTASSFSLPFLCSLFLALAFRTVNLEEGEGGKLKAEHAHLLHATISTDRCKLPGCLEMHNYGFKINRTGS